MGQGTEIGVQFNSKPMLSFYFNLNIAFNLKVTIITPLKEKF